jgi:RND family efflux transporter MFP subunit
MRLKSDLAMALPSIALLVSCMGSKDDRAVLPPPTAVPSIQPAPEGKVTSTTSEVETKPIAGQSAASASIGNSSASTETPIGIPEASQATASRFTGGVDAPRKSLLAFRQTGFIAEILAKPGTELKKGDPLATLDDRDYRIRLELAKMKAEQAKIQFDAAGKDYQREKELQKENASTAAAVDKMKLTFDSAKIALRLAELDAEAANFAFKDAKLLAPYDCVVAVQLKYEGENLQSGNPVFEIYDTAEPEIRLAVPERMFGQVAIGTVLSVSIPSANYTGKAKIVRLVPVIAEKTRTFQIIARLEKFDSHIVPGSYAEATLN